MKDFFEGQGYRNIKKRVLIAITILIIIIICSVIYLTVLKTEKCSDQECFFSSLENCERTSWVNENEKSTYKYTILSNIDKQKCKVNVQLLNLKQGSAENERLLTKSMICNVQKTETQSPDKDLSMCSGPLKEEMQNLIIQKMHNYLLENIGEIKEEFKEI